MAERKQAVVVGALGVIGRYIVERLLEEDDWSVVGLSRRAAEAAPRYRHICVDLLDQRGTAASSATCRTPRTSSTPRFSLPPAPPQAMRPTSAPNRDMLVNAVTAIDAASRALRRVVLVTGTKYYGSHLGPFKTPARESDPRHMPPDYYFDQIDWLTGFQRGKSWDWVELRPQTLCGFAPGTPMSSLPRSRSMPRSARSSGCRCGSPASRAPTRRSTRSRSPRTLPTPRCGRPPSRAAGAKRSTSPTATISAGRTCGRSSPLPSTCRPAIRRPSA